MLLVLKVGRLLGSRLFFLGQKLELPSYDFLRVKGVLFFHFDLLELKLIIFWLTTSALGASGALHDLLPFWVWLCSLRLPESVSSFVGPSGVLPAGPVVRQLTT